MNTQRTTVHVTSRARSVLHFAVVILLLLAIVAGGVLCFAGIFSHPLQFDLAIGGSLLMLAAKLVDLAIGASAPEKKVP